MVQQSDVAQDMLQTVRKYLCSVSGIRSFVKEELQQFNSSVGENENEEEKEENECLAHAHKVYTQIFALRREIELKKIQLEIRLLDYENAYRGRGFKLTDVYKRKPELVRECTCNGIGKFCRFHSGADMVYTNVYEPHFVERAGCSFIIVDVIADLIQLCVPTGHWLTFYNNQILAISWHMYYLLIPDLSKPLSITLPLGDGYCVKYKKKSPNPWFGFVDLEGNSFEFTGYQAVRILHTICLRFPDIKRGHLGRADVPIPCLFTHESLQQANSCISCSTPLYQSN